jgi:hypothetical protein
MISAILSLALGLPTINTAVPVISECCRLTWNSDGTWNTVELRGNVHASADMDPLVSVAEDTPPMSHCGGFDETNIEKMRPCVTIDGVQP